MKLFLWCTFFKLNNPPIFSTELVLVQTDITSHLENNLIFLKIESSNLLISNEHSNLLRNVELKVEDGNYKLAVFPFIYENQQYVCENARYTLSIQYFISSETHNSVGTAIITHNVRQLGQIFMSISIKDNLTVCLTLLCPDTYKKHYELISKGHPLIELPADITFECSGDSIVIKSREKVN